MIPLLSFTFMRIVELFSGVLIEKGGYLSETGINGSANGAFSRLSIYYIIFIMLVIVFYNRISSFFSINKKTNINNKFIFLSFLFSFLIITAGILSGFIYGFSFSAGINRFEFRELNSNSFLFFFLNNRFFLMILLGTIFSSENSLITKIASSSFSFVLLVVSVLHGEQFTSMVVLLFAFFTGYLVIQSINGIDVASKVISISFFVVICGTAAVLLIYSKQGYYLAEIANRRLILQGQLWYVVDLNSNGIFDANFDSFLRNVNSFFEFNTDNFSDYNNPYGMRELMYKHALPDIYDIYMQNNVTFTMGQMAIALYWFGYILIVPFLLVTAFLFSLSIYYLISSIMSFSLISVFLSTKIFSWLLFGLQQGEYWYFFGVKTILFSLFAILFELFRKKLYQSIT